MLDSFYIGAYWGSRAEPLDQVKNKIIQTLKLLGELDEQFLNWYELGMSRKKALENKFVSNDENIKRLCLQKVKKGELDKNGFSKSGFIFSLWTGHKEEEASSISFVVGDELKISNLGNSCVIKIPYEGDAKDRLLKIDKAKKIISFLVEIWNPDYAVLTSHVLGNKLNVLNEIGWITYRKSIKRISKISDSIFHEESENGHWFFLKSEYDIAVANDLLSIKKMI